MWMHDYLYEITTRRCSLVSGAAVEGVSDYPYRELRCRTYRDLGPREG